MRTLPTVFFILFFVIPFATAELNDEEGINALRAMSEQGQAALINADQRGSAALREADEKGKQALIKMDEKGKEGLKKLEENEAKKKTKKRKEQMAELETPEPEYPLEMVSGTMRVANPAGE